MKGDPEFLILKHPTWLDTSKFESRILGAIIRYPLRPADEYLPRDKPPLDYYTQPDFQESSFTDFTLANTSTNFTHASAALHSLAGFDFKGNTADSIHLAGKIIRYKRLYQFDQFWDRLKTDASVRDEVPGWISLVNTWPPCLVVGIMIAEDAVGVDLKSGAAREISAEIQVPLTSMAAAGGITSVPMVGDVGDINVGGGKSRENEKIFMAKKSGSSIFALELRIVTTRLLRWKELKLREGGPKVEESGRLAASGEDSSSEDDDDEEPSVEDLILEGFTEKEYAQMAE